MKFMILCLLMSTLAQGNNPIDVVIPCHEKDGQTLELCIEGIKNHGKDIRNIYVISAKPLTPKALWVDEKNFPFTKNDILATIFRNNQKAMNHYVSTPHPGGNRMGWIFQQLLKLYAVYVIPNLSENLLVLDADTVFVNPVSFFDAQGNALYNVANENHKPYFEHASRLLPGFKKVYANKSGITHHMIFQRPVLDNLFNKIRITHGVEPWIALCKCIDQNQMFACLSEYEIYFNFAFSTPHNVKIRPLKHTQFKFDPKKIFTAQKEGFHYVSCHAYLKAKRS